MTIRETRILGIALLPVIFLSKQYQILYYLPVMMLSLEFLNRQKTYLQAFNFRLLNSIFMSYLAFICLERGRPFVFGDTVEMIINSIEHILFGIIICIKAAVYYSILKRKAGLEKYELTIIFLVFNFFGFINEFFQNLYKHHPVMLLNFDSKKDIVMNIIGSLLFIFFYKKISKKIRLLHPI